MEGRKEKKGREGKGKDQKGKELDASPGAPGPSWFPVLVPQDRLVSSPVRPVPVPQDRPGAPGPSGCQSWGSQSWCPRTGRPGKGKQGKKGRRGRKGRKGRGTFPGKTFYLEGKTFQLGQKLSD